MNQKRCSLRMIRYEIRNLNGNLMTHFFAFVFPNFFSLILVKAIGSDVPGEYLQQFKTEIMLSVSLVIPLSVMFLGYGALYSNEVEREIPLRMRLFGYQEKSLITAKLAAHLILMTIAVLAYGIFWTVVIGIAKPAVSSFLILLLCLYLVGAVFLVVSHALANIFRKFSITFGVEMFFYFLIMIVCGMMGVRTSQLPDALQKVAALFPMSYICNDFASFWQGGQYNFMPLIQSFLFVGAMAGILLLYALYKSRRATV